MPKVLINGFAMNYIRYGTGPPLLIVHGFTDSSRLWQAQVNFFAARFTTFAIDLIGHGLSESRETDYSISSLTNDVYEFLRETNLTNVSLLGHSMGGMIAQQFAIDNPEALRSLVLCSTASSGRAMKEAGGFDCMATLKAIAKDGFEQSIRNSARYLFAEGTASEVMDFTLSEEMKTNRAAALGCLKGMWEWDATRRLSEITAPTMIVVGDKDQATPLACSQNLRNAVPHASMKIVNECGHMISVEKPQEVNLIVQRFLSSS